LSYERRPVRPLTSLAGARLILKSLPATAAHAPNEQPDAGGA